MSIANVIQKLFGFPEPEPTSVIMIYTEDGGQLLIECPSRLVNVPKLASLGGMPGVASVLLGDH